MKSVKANYSNGKWETVCPTCGKEWVAFVDEDGQDFCLSKFCEHLSHIGFNEKRKFVFLMKEV